MSLTFLLSRPYRPQTPDCYLAVMTGRYYFRSRSEMMIVREKMYIFNLREGDPVWWLLMTKKRPRRGNRNTAIMKSNQYTKLQEYSPEEQNDWTMDYGIFGSKMIQRQNPKNQEISIEYEMSEGW